MNVTIACFLNSTYCLCRCTPIISLSQNDNFDSLLPLVLLSNGYCTYSIAECLCGAGEVSHVRNK